MEKYAYVKILQEKLKYYKQPQCHRITLKTSRNRAWAIQSSIRRRTNKLRLPTAESHNSSLRLRPRSDLDKTS